LEPSPVDVKQLLTQANLARVRGNWAEAERKCQQAVTAAPDQAEAWELLGDACYAQSKGAQAINYYRKAYALQPARATLEEKIGRASLLIARQELIMNAPDLFLAGYQRTRKPSLAAFFSLIAPGLGQLYNRQWLKGSLLLLLYLGSVIALTGTATQALRLLRGSAAVVDITRIINVFFTGWPLLCGVLVLLVYLYAVADAAWVASRGEEMWSPHLP